MRAWKLIETGRSRNRHLGHVAHLVARSADWAEPACGSRAGWARTATDEPRCAHCLKTASDAERGIDPEAAHESASGPHSPAADLSDLEDRSGQAGTLCALEVRPDPGFRPGPWERSRTRNGTYDRINPLILTFTSVYERTVVVDAFRESRRARPDRIVTLLAEAAAS